MKRTISNEDDTCTTQYISADGTLSFYSGCEDGNGCYNSNEYCSDCIDVWPDYDTCGATYEEDVYAWNDFFKITSFWYLIVRPDSKLVQ